jgi:hypothetical protein
MTTATLGTALTLIQPAVSRTLLKRAVLFSCLAMMNHHHDVPTYLQETLESVDPNKQFTVTEQDRKSMVQGIMGISKVDLDQQLRDTKLEAQWEKAQAFMADQWIPKIGGEGASFNPDDPSIRMLSADNDGSSRNMDSFATPTKYFSYLAKGRTFQGKFDRLLESVAPDLLECYQETVDEIDRLECMRILADKHERRGDLLRCLHLQLPKSSPQPADGGVSSGKKGELDLETYLRSERHNGASNYELCTHVLVKPPRSKIKKGETFVIETSHLSDGSTSEFDAMFIERTGNGSIRVVELWEAKATIHPTTLADLIFKKVKSLERILEDDKAIFYIDGVHYPLDTTSPLPLIGMFGSGFLSAKAAANRQQLVAFQNQLGKDEKLVMTVLENEGLAPAPDVSSQLRYLMDEVERLKPTVVIGK